MGNAAKAEWDRLKEVPIHRPGIEMLFSLMELSSFLSERAFSVDGAVYEHTLLVPPSSAKSFVWVRDRKVIAVEVEQGLDRVLAGVVRAVRRDPHRYGTLLSLARSARAGLQGGRGFFPHTAAVRDRGIQVTPLGSQEIPGGYGGAHGMTCVTNRTGA